MRAVSIFTGAGGLDIGFEQAGFDIVSTLEIHPKYCETIRINQSARHPIPNRVGRFYLDHANVIEGDIRQIAGRDLFNGSGNLDCLIGGPPCQAFSSAGKQNSIFDARGTLVYEYQRILTELQPKVFLFENVRGLVTARGKGDEPGEVLLGLLQSFRLLGYNCAVSLLNAADFGAYQRRVRCLIVGSRIGPAPEFPIPTHSATPVESLFATDNRRAWNTLGDFLATHADNDMSTWVRPTAKLLAELVDIPSGSGLKSQGRREATRPGGHWGYRQGTFIADMTKPARTVTGSSSQDWIRLPDGTLRRLTLREVAGLQGFPEGWVFAGSQADQFQQVGNAVPTVFGRVMGCILSDYLRRKHPRILALHDPVIDEAIFECIRYTKIDNEKNGAYRARAQRRSPVAIDDQA